MTEEEKNNKEKEKETYTIKPEPEYPGIIYGENGEPVIINLDANGKIDSMVERFHWLVSSPDGNRFDIAKVNADNQSELDKLQTSFSAYHTEFSQGYESDIKSLRRRSEYRLTRGMPSSGEIQSAFREDLRSGVVLLGRAIRNSLSAISSKEPDCCLKEPVLKTLVASKSITQQDAETIATILDSADLAECVIRFELPEEDVIAQWLSVYRKIATVAI